MDSWTFKQNHPDIFKLPALSNPNLMHAWPHCFLTATRPPVGLVSLGQTRACGTSAFRPILLGYQTGNGSKLIVLFFLKHLLAFCLRVFVFSLLHPFVCVHVTQIVFFNVTISDKGRINVMKKCDEQRTNADVITEHAQSTQLTHQTHIWKVT